MHHPWFENRFLVDLSKDVLRTLDDKTKISDQIFGRKFPQILQYFNQDVFILEILMLNTSWETIGYEGARKRLIISGKIFGRSVILSWTGKSKKKYRDAILYK